MARNACYNTTTWDLSLSLSLSRSLSHTHTLSLSLTHSFSLNLALALFAYSQPRRHTWKLSTRAARVSEWAMAATTARMLGTCRHTRGNRFLINSLTTLTYIHKCTCIHAYMNSCIHTYIHTNRRNLSPLPPSHTARPKQSFMFPYW